MSTVHQLKTNTIQCLFYNRNTFSWMVSLPSLCVSLPFFLSFNQSVSLCLFSLNLSLHNWHTHSQPKRIMQLFKMKWLSSNCELFLSLKNVKLFNTAQPVYLFRYEQKQRWDKIKIPYFTFGCRLTGQCYVLEITSL